MAQDKQSANEQSHRPHTTDQRQPQPEGLGNQNVTRPAPIEQSENQPLEPGQKGLEKQNISKPGPIGRS